MSGSNAWLPLVQFLPKVLDVFEVWNLYRVVNVLHNRKKISLSTWLCTNRNGNAGKGKKNHKFLVFAKYDWEWFTQSFLKSLRSCQNFHFTMLGLKIQSKDALNKQQTLQIPLQPVWSVQHNDFHTSREFGSSFACVIMEQINCAVTTEKAHLLYSPCSSAEGRFRADLILLLWQVSAL